jgi:hypothetical protein
MRSASLISAMVVAAACPAQDANDLPWRIGPDDELQVRELADGLRARELQLGEWTPMFPGLFARRAAGAPQLDWVRASATILVVPLLAHGDGGAAAIDEATLRLRKLGIGTTIDWFALCRLAPDPLLDLLHVRHLAAHDLLATTYALTRFATDETRSPFVRAAAAAALRERRGAEDEAKQVADAVPARRGAAALQDGLALMPDDVDLVLGVHGASLPPTAPLYAAWRQLVLRFHSAAVLMSSGSVGPSSMTTGQLLMDRPGQLPFEIARRCGNWRVDHALLALRRGEQPGFWLHLGGEFQPARIAEGLHAGNFEFAPAQPGEVRATLHGVKVHATKTSLVAWSEGVELGSTGARMTVLHDRAAADAPPLWVHVPATSRLTATFAAGTTFDVRVDPQRGRATARATCADRAAAQALLTAWRTWQAARECDPATPIPAPEPKERDAPEPYGGGVTWGELATLPPGCREDDRSRLVWRQLVQAVRAEIGADEIAWTLDLARFELLDLVRLLGESPVAWIEHG